VRAVLFRLNLVACLGYPSSEASRLLSSSENRLERVVLGTLLLLPPALVEGLVRVLPQLDGQTVALLVFLGVFGGAFGFFLWTFALTRLTPTQVAVHISLNPLVAMVLAAALLAERLTIMFVAGFFAVLLGVLSVNWPKRTPAAPAERSR
jgi:drug/metabolite transporter (DMT)-like permease